MQSALADGCEMRSRYVSGSSAQCVCSMRAQADGGPVRSAVAVGGDMHSRQLEGWLRGKQHPAP